MDSGGIFISPHGAGYPGQEAGHSGVDAGFLCHGAARAPADHAQQPVAARLRQTVGCYEGAAAVPLTGIGSSFLITGTEHGGGDLVVVVIRGVTDRIADYGNVGLLEDNRLRAVILDVSPACHRANLTVNQPLTVGGQTHGLDVVYGKQER